MPRGPLGGPRPLSRKQIEVVMSGTTQQQEDLREIVEDRVASMGMEPTASNATTREGNTIISVQTNANLIALDDLQSLKSRLDEVATVSDIAIGRVMSLGVV